MLVDEYEQYQNNNDRTDVVVVSRSGSEEPEQEPLADDRKSPHHPPRLFRHDSVPKAPQRRGRHGHTQIIGASCSNRCDRRMISNANLDYRRSDDGTTSAEGPRTGDRG